MVKEQHLEAFSEYANEIYGILNSIIYDNEKVSEELINSILNGKTTSELKRLVSLKYRKSNGIFFTGSILSEKVANKVKHFLKNGQKVLDPACGAGNLLLFCLYLMPKKSTLYETLESWSNTLYGYDLHEDFVLTARLRFLLYAISLFPNERFSYFDIEKFFYNIEVKDSLKIENLNKKHDCVVLNPPFGYSKSNVTCEWAKGKVQLAALFLEKVIVDAPEGQHIVSILPDVLRSGTRYNKWRKFVCDNSKFLEIDQCGRFDRDTDVDVFILHIVKSNNPVGLTFYKDEKHPNILSDFFEICIGSVVPHRDPEIGPICKFLHVKNAPAEKVVNKILEKKNYFGKTFKAPFLTIHRTSSPSDKKRCKVTVVDTKGAIAIENHLIVLKPKDNSLETCLKFQQLLSSDKTTRWLNKHIRCRHLTIASVKNIPVEEESIKCKEE
jgi:hypothetical protein